MKNLALTGIRSPDRPARSQSLYRSSYPAYNLRMELLIFISKGEMNSSYNSALNTHVYVVPSCQHIYSRPHGVTPETKI